MQFTFVRHNGPRPEKAELVKSHVMRESQRKRRQARARPSVAEPEVVSGDKVDQTGLQTASQIPYVGSHGPLSGKLEPHPQQAATQFGTAGQDYSGVQNHGHRIGQYGGDYVERLAVRNAGSGSQVSVSKPSYDPRYMSDDINDEATLAVFDDDLSDRPCEATPRLSLQPSAYPGSAKTSWLSPELFGRTMELMSHYVNTLDLEIPGLPPINPFGAYWLPAAGQNPKILLACCLFYCAHRDVLSKTTGNDHYYYKGRALRTVNESFDNPATRVSDDTFAAVLCITMYEFLLGSEVTAVHLQGLRRMAELRGGVNELWGERGRHIGEMLLTQDILYSACYNTDSHIVDLLGPVLRDFQWVCYHENFCTNSPLRIVRDLETIKFDTRLKDIFEYLADAFEATELLFVEAFDPKTAKAQKDWFAYRRDLFWQHLVKPVESRSANLESGTYEETVPEVKHIIRLTARIHHRAVCRKIFYEDEVNTKDMLELHDLLRKVDCSATWTRAHYVHCWVILTGAAAARYHICIRSFFATEMIRLGLTVGIFDWRAYKQTVGNFLWIQYFLRQSNFSK